MHRALSYVSYGLSLLCFMVIIGAIGGIDCDTMGLMKGAVIALVAMAGWVFFAMLGGIMEEGVSYE